MLFDLICMTITALNLNAVLTSVTQTLIQHQLCNTIFYWLIPTVHALVPQSLLIMYINNQSLPHYVHKQPITAYSVYKLPTIAHAMYRQPIIVHSVYKCRYLEKVPPVVPSHHLQCNIWMNCSKGRSFSNSFAVYPLLHLLSLSLWCLC